MVCAPLGLGEIGSDFFLRRVCVTGIRYQMKPALIFWLAKRVLSLARGQYCFEVWFGLVWFCGGTAVCALAKAPAMANATVFCIWRLTGAREGQTGVR